MATGLKELAASASIPPTPPATLPSRSHGGCEGGRKKGEKKKGEKTGSEGDRVRPVPGGATTGGVKAPAPQRRTRSAPFFARNSIATFGTKKERGENGNHGVRGLGPTTENGVAPGSEVDQRRYSIESSSSRAPAIGRAERGREEKKKSVGAAILNQHQRKRNREKKGFSPLSAAGRAHETKKKEKRKGLAHYFSWAAGCCSPFLLISFSIQRKKKVGGPASPSGAGEPALTVLAADPGLIKRRERRRKKKKSGSDLTRAALLSFACFCFRGVALRGRTEKKKEEGRARFEGWRKGTSAVWASSAYLCISTP